MHSYQYNLGLKFAAVAEQHADRIALRYPTGHTFTYRQLLMRARQFARLLLSRGMTAGDVLCIFHNQSFDAFAAMLGAMSVGVIYTNVDLSSPDARVLRMLQQVEPRLILAAQPNLTRAGSLAQQVGCRLECFEDPLLQTEVMAYPSDALIETPAITGQHPAYLMFTSGSAGYPKASIATHDNVLNFSNWVRERFLIGPDDVFTNLNPLAYDNAVFDFFGSLFNGAAMIPFSREIQTQPRELVDAINELGCTIWFSVPSLLIYLLRLRALRPGDLRGLGTVAFGGETFPKAPLRQLARHLGAGIQLINVYGMCETTSIAAAYTLKQRDLVDEKPLPLGHLGENFQGYVVDEVRQQVPEGGIGELCISGPGLGLGYYRDPDRTDRAFIRNPWRLNYRETLYRTGDLVRQDPETGYYVFLGRKDNQIQHEGHRIELEEIEAALGALEGISECCVVYHRDPNGQGRIAAYVNAKDFDDQVMLTALRCRLPSYMLPHQIISLSPLPKNVDGKVDRHQLSAMTL